MAKMRCLLLLGSTLSALGDVAAPATSVATGGLLNGVSIDSLASQAEKASQGDTGAITTLATQATSIATRAAGGNAICALNAADAVNRVVHTILFVWAASKRCGEPDGVVECEIDISSAIESLSDVIDSILKVAKGCNLKNVTHHEHDCAMAVNDLASGTAGLASASGIIANKCPSAVMDFKGQVQDRFNGSRRLGGLPKYHKCMVQVGKILSSGLEVTQTVSKKLMSIKRVCDDTSNQALCSLHAITSVAAFADLGSHLAGIISECSGYHGFTLPGSKMAGCSQGVLKLIGKLHEVAGAGLSISDKCHINSQLEGMKLYAETDTIAPLNSNSMALSLAFILPIAMVMSFFGGARFAKSRPRQAANPDGFTGLNGFGRREVFGDDVIEALPLAEESFGLAFHPSHEAARSSARCVTPRFDL